MHRVCFSLLRNPVSAKKYYRLYAIYKIPSLRVLDFQKIKQRVRLIRISKFYTRVLVLVF